MARPPQVVMADLSARLERIRESVELVYEVRDPEVIAAILDIVFIHETKLEELYPADAIASVDEETREIERGLVVDYCQWKRTNRLMGQVPSFHVLEFYRVAEHLDDLEGPEMDAGDLASGSTKVMRYRGSVSLVWALWLSQEFIRFARDFPLADTEKLVDIAQERGRQGDPHGALAMYRSILESSPNFILARVRAGNIWINAFNSPDAALRFFELPKCRNLVPEHLLFYNAAIAQAALGNLESSISCCEQALSIKRDYEVALTLRARLEQARRSISK